MKPKWGWKDGVLWLLILIPLVATWMLYDRLPEQMAVHFNVSDQPDGYSSKQGFLFTELGLLVGLPVLLSLGRLIDPKRENYSKFSNVIEIMRLGVTMMMSIVIGFLLMYNLGYEYSSSSMASLLVGALFLLIGNYLGQLRVNYFFGIRTPWALTSEENWRRTHRFAGPVWMICGLVMLGGMFLPGAINIWVMGCSAGVASLLPVCYSYWLFRSGY